LCRYSPAPSSGFIALYLALQLCQKVAVYGMSLEAGGLYSCESS
jgi:hypothetical protein